MFGDKFPKLTSAIGREDHTDEQMNELNAQILEKGIKGLVIVRNSDLVQKEKEVSDAFAAKIKAEDALATATADRDAWKTKAEEFGDQPGAVKTNVKVKKDKAADEGKGFKSNPSASYNQKANKALGLPVED